ncbi:hypothetical protein BEWA_022170 [Theileria equi strain WA]|uniref:Uncharacterized protein n=1 Tax=Theileria equi strain WA TaxID=1537102 RepID=L0AWU7_THEEQ|nr:hypothetical protein BEWA_022170 [Theileria equi strain WA]AFZ79369.1 hypothetical protein BEWA_022170 [Theileria equi strain WA]|eukprot:XP_004829035.1 hypothetical protein BEWA_022170 [Theileria equi strain WA]
MNTGALTIDIAEIDDKSVIINENVVNGLSQTVITPKEGGFIGIVREGDSEIWRSDGYELGIDLRIFSSNGSIKIVTILMNSPGRPILRSFRKKRNKWKIIRTGRLGKKLRKMLKNKMYAEFIPHLEDIEEEYCEFENVATEMISVETQSIKGPYSTGAFPGKAHQFKNLINLVPWIYTQYNPY